MADVESGRQFPRSVGNRRLLRSMILLGSCTVVAKLVALVKDLLVARQLGAGDVLDSYLIALILPSYASVVLAQAIAAAFVPSYVRLWQRSGLSAAQRLAGQMLAATLLVLVVVTLGMVATSPLLLPLLGLDYDPAKLRLTQTMFYWMSGIVLATGVSALLAAVLNAHERFVAAALAPLAIPVGTLGAFALYGPSQGVYALAAGTLVGYAGELLVLLVAVTRAGLLPRLRLGGPRQELRGVGKQYLPVAVSGLLMSSSMIIDQSMAASLGSGQVSVLNYGGKIVAVVLTVVAVSISTVLFPRFSHLIAAGRGDELRRTFRNLSLAILSLSVPAIAILALITEPVVRLLFERGAFTAETTEAVSRVQLWLLPQIGFYVLHMLGARVLSALDSNMAVLRIAAINVAVNVAGNYVLMQWFGVAGIAMATSLMYAVAAVATLGSIRGRLAEMPLPSPANQATRPERE